MKFYKEFIFDIYIIERISMQIWAFCYTCDRKREFDVILIHGMWIMCFATGAFQIPLRCFWQLRSQRVACWTLGDCAAATNDDMIIRMTLNETFYAKYLQSWWGSALVQQFTMNIANMVVIFHIHWITTILWYQCILMMSLNRYSKFFRLYLHYLQRYDMI